MRLAIETSGGFPPDGRAFLTLGADGTVKLRDAVTGGVSSRLMIANSPAISALFRATALCVRVGLTDQLTAFKIADNRDAGVARSILGVGREKVVISDRFASYDWIEPHQYCWSHLRRDFQAMVDRRDDG